MVVQRAIQVLEAMELFSDMEVIRKKCVEDIVIRQIIGWSSRRIGDLYCGLVKNTSAPWKHLRTTVHDHHPVNDAKGNAEALLKIRDMGLKIKLV